MQDFSKKIAAEWKSLSNKKKEFYQKIYEIRMREKTDLHD